VHAEPRSALLGCAQRPEARASRPFFMFDFGLDELERFSR
jgi:hypothetical protein